VKVFADYPSCEKHKQIYEDAKMRELEMQKALEAMTEHFL
jgi:hypothetical protein